MKQSVIAKGVLFFALFVLCLFPFIDAPTALLIGFLTSLFFGNPFQHSIARTANLFLKVSIVGLGFGMDFGEAIAIGKTGFFLTLGTISFVLLVGWVLGRLIKVNSKISYLLSSGTAICGGSAIAAVAPIVKADSQQTSVALGAVFILNALGLFVFPFIGGLVHLSQYQFGLWSAIAIHDTSSVVGAASSYGRTALEVATSVKLGRALWIIPLTLITAWFYKGNGSKLKIPYFILFFVLAMLLSSALPEFQTSFSSISYFAKSLLVATLFLIGAGLSLKTIRAVGLKTFLQASILWVLVSVLSLLLITQFF